MRNTRVDCAELRHPGYLAVMHNVFIATNCDFVVAKSYELTSDGRGWRCRIQTKLFEKSAVRVLRLQRREFDRHGVQAIRIRIGGLACVALIEVCCDGV